MPKVLISDKMSPRAEEIFKSRGLKVDVITDLSPEELKSKIGSYDGLAVRSSTKVTPEILDAATNLKVIGRAGIGVDNIDTNYATAKGVIVMNTPFGNAVTTAEHAFSMMMALARQIPQANASTHAGKWEKKKFMGVELYSKTLGIVGCGNIGAIVASRALGLQMKVIAYDPFLTQERAEKLGIERVELQELMQRSDFVTIHTPLNDKTRGLINAEMLSLAKPGLRLINCARGGLVVEKDLLAALENGQIAGAALDVFEVEPAHENPLFGREDVICTPHLGASTSEAQENVAIQVAEQLSDYLLSGAITNALNMPSVSAEEAPKLKPYLGLARAIGALAGQIGESAIEEVVIDYTGQAASLNTGPLSAVILAGLLKPISDQVNMVNAKTIAKDKGITVSESKTQKADDYTTAIRIAVTSEKRKRALTGTLNAAGFPRIVEIEGAKIEASIGENMLFVRNEDKPGFIGALGGYLGDKGYNIGHFYLGRKEDDHSALSMISLDRAIEQDDIKGILDLPHILQAQKLEFENFG